MRTSGLIVAVFLFACAIASPNANAWHGYPPNGAWVYGGGPSYVTRTRTVYRTRPLFPFGWGRVATSRVYYGYRPYVRPYFVYPRYTYFYTPVVRVVRPVVPVVVAPLCATTPTYSVGLSIAAKTPQPSAIAGNVSNAFARAPMSSNSKPLSLDTVAANTRTSSKLVAKQVSTASLSTEAVPSELLQAADSILEAGGYSEAAKAYAQLSVRFGSSELLMARRFVAQTALGDFAQAEAILELARLRTPGLQFVIGQKLTKFVGHPVIALRTEQMAKRAMDRGSDSATFRSLAQWLHLQGETEKAALFNQRAEQIDGISSPKTSTDSAPKVATPRAVGTSSNLLTAR